MRILIAADKFKGTLTAAQVAGHLSGPLSAAGHAVDCVPIADGGDGTVAAAVAAGLSAQGAEATGPLGAPVTAHWARSGATAVIELAEASGLALVSESTATTALRASSTGTGELIRAALEAGCTRIVVGVGGSACTDGGAGLLQALGAELTAADGAGLQPGGGALPSLATADLEPARALLAAHGARLVLASDVDNPLLGSAGAAAVYGPQKGAGPAEVAALDAGLARLADLLDPAGELRGRPGAGASGGVGFALLTLGAEQVSGASYVMDLAGFDAALRQAELVVTGEGRFDAQTLSGKGPGAVVRAARAAGIPVWMVCGGSEVSAAQARAAGLSGVLALTDEAPLAAALADPGPLLAGAARRLAARLGG